MFVCLFLCVCGEPTQVNRLQYPVFSLSSLQLHHNHAYRSAGDWHGMAGCSASSRCPEGTYCAGDGEIGFAGEGGQGLRRNSNQLSNQLGRLIRTPLPMHCCQQQQMLSDPPLKAMLPLAARPESARHRTKTATGCAARMLPGTPPSFAAAVVRHFSRASVRCPCNCKPTGWQPWSRTVYTRSQ